MKISVYIGRSNSEILHLYLEAADSHKISAADFLSGVTRIQLISRAGIIDSQVAPTALVLDAAASTLTLSLGSHFTQAGIYPAQLVFFTAAYPDGFVWIDRYDAASNRRLTLHVMPGS